MMEEVKKVEMSAIEFVNATANLLEGYAKKHNMSKEVGYEVVIEPTNYKFERLDDTLWVSNPNGRDPAQEVKKRLDLATMKDAKKVTLAVKINFLENFLTECKKHKTNIRILNFEATRRQRKQKEYTALIDSVKAVF